MTDIKKETKESCWRKMFVPKTDGDFWPRAFRGTLAGVSVGALFGSMRSVWTSAPYSKFAADKSFKQSLKTIGRPMGYMAAAGFLYEGLSAAFYQTRGRSDWKDAVLVGVILGCLAGFSRRSFVDAGKYAVLLGAINGSIEAADPKGYIKPQTPQYLNKRNIYRKDN